MELIRTIVPILVLIVQVIILVKILWRLVTNVNFYIKKHGKKNVGIHQHGVDTQNFPYESLTKNLTING
jgi:hypothetical protein